MKFFFPDSQDFVDPSFDFRSEQRSENRVRQRDDMYPHEIFETPPYDGILVSKAVVDGIGQLGRYSMAQRQRLLRVGATEFFRLYGRTGLETMGDCGAFSYVKEERPPFTPDQVIDFYSECGFTYGLSVDHVILGFQETPLLPGLDAVIEGWKRRQELTLELASEFLNRHRVRKCAFVPVGVAQGWDPTSYARSVTLLQNMGYRLIAIGGLVPLKTPDILRCLQKVNEVRKPDVSFHLLGITRCEHLEEFRKYGAISFDSTSPLRQAFKDDRDNYYTSTRNYLALRVPQVDGNPRIKKRILAGQIDQANALRLERNCMQTLIAYDQGRTSLDAAVEALGAYEKVHDGVQDRTPLYREVLTDQPWKDCPCAICRDLGIHVIIFRGAERNRRRGFHNLFVFYSTLQAQLALRTGRTAAPGPNGGEIHDRT